MKQKFFTFLAMLMFVSVNAVADGTVPVSISKKYGATTLVCNQDLDFSTVATSMRPYYIEDYGTSTGNFSLKAFTDAKVPANTPMILIGKQYPQAGNSDVVMCDVPVATSIDNAAQVRKDVFTKAGGHAWLMPVINGSYVCSNFNAENAEGTDDEKVYNMTFFNYAAGGSKLVPQTESVSFGQHDEQSIQEIVTKTYFSDYNLLTEIPTIKGLSRTAWNGKQGLGQRIYWANIERAGFITGVQPSKPGGGEYVAGDYCVLYYPSTTEIDEFWGDETTYPMVPSLWQVSGEGERRAWDFVRLLDTVEGEERYAYDPATSHWIMNVDKSSSIVTTYVANSNRNVYNYVLSVNSSGNPVFKLCNGTSGTTVPYGKCYVSVWSDVKAAASSREDIGIEFAEDEEDLSELNEEVSGIKNVNIKKEANGIYNINGQKLVKLQKGLNIVNGKKVYVK